jgi:hypothetical protein
MGKIYTVDHTNDIFNVFLNTFLIHFESCFPIEYVTKKSRDNSWITPDIRISCKRKHSLYLLSKASNNPYIKSYYLLYSKILRKVIRKAKLMYYNNIISQSDNKSKSSWRLLRNEMGVIKNKKLQTTYKIENQCIRSNNAANAFNDYFINIMDTLPISKFDIDHAVQLLQNSFPQGFPGMPNIPITESEIICTIKSLKSKDSSGYDGISNRILKVCGQYLGKPLAYVYNISLK